jgi:cleavage and polyadenylation specificity factor subunit 2
MNHCGALPYVMKGNSFPVFATIPVHSLGQMTLYDYLKSKVQMEDFDAFSISDVDYAFERKLVSLKYSQPYSLTGRCLGITITAYPAGHTLGGTIWKIKKDTDVIVYAVDYNHKRERYIFHY